MQAACNLITACLSSIAVSLSVLDQLVFHFVDIAMRRRESDVYEAVARMLTRLSELRIADDVLTRYDNNYFTVNSNDRLTTMISSGRPIPRQIAALSLGTIRLAGCKTHASRVVNILLAQLEESAKVGLAAGFVLQG